MSTHRSILIAGPTASGKSKLAVALARYLGGAVINADSAQVYAELSILTARPSAEEEAAVPHRLYGHVSGREAYSAARFVADAQLAIEEARNAGLVPIVVGGTGLYFKALTEGLSPIPAIPDDIRKRWREAARGEGPEALHAELARRDPDTAARLRPTDPQRLARALEVLDATGRGLADWQRDPGEPIIASEAALKLVVALERECVMRRAERRFEHMLAAGALEEVRALAALGLSPELPVMRALGVPPLMDHLSGRSDLAVACEAAKRDTRHYVKRQITWLRRHMIAWNSINSQDMERILGGDFSLIEN